MERPIVFADAACRATVDLSTIDEGSDATVARAVSEAMAMAFVLMYIVDMVITSLRERPVNVGNIVANMILEGSEK